MPFAEAVARCAAASNGGSSEGNDGSGGAAANNSSTTSDKAGSGDGEALPAFAPILAAGERYYLRSVGLDPRKDAADFPALFPELAAECSRLLPRAPHAPDAEGAVA
eukprot:408447-Prymnesium_polylepis.1